MSYSLEQLPDGNFRLEIGGGNVCFSMEMFRGIRSEIDRLERREYIKRHADEEKEKDAKLQAAGVGAALPVQSIFRRAIATGNVDSIIISAITSGLVYPNGSRLWSAYFSKIDWEGDGHLFAPLLEGTYSHSGDALARFMTHHRDTMTRDIFDYLSDSRIEYINKTSGGGTHLINVGLTDSRDYTPFGFACAKVYGIDPREHTARCDVDFAKKNFTTMIDAIYDASLFIREGQGRIRSACPALDGYPIAEYLKESAMCAVYLSRFFTDHQWDEICRSPVWLLVKDIVAVRRPSRPVAA